MTSFNGGVHSPMQGQPMQGNGMQGMAGHMPNTAPPLSAQDQRKVSLALQTLSLTNDEKRAVNLIFERQGKTAEAARLAVFSPLTPVQQAAFYGALNKIEMIGLENLQQTPTQPNQQGQVGQQQQNLQTGGGLPTTNQAITGFSGAPFASGVTNNGQMTSAF